MKELCIIRGGGDLATGVAWRLSRSGFPTVVTELAQPLAVRRTVCLSTAVDDGLVNVEGLTGRLASNEADARSIAGRGEVAVLVSPGIPTMNQAVVIDARLAKRNIDTSIADAPLVIALGPGFTAGLDCHAVVETKRGSRLGRAIWEGSAAPDTGVPGEIGGRSQERVLRSPRSGRVEWASFIGSRVTAGEVLGKVDGAEVVAPFDGLVRGLIRPGHGVQNGMKIGDVDPRMDSSISEISDKALAIGGGVLEAVMTHLSSAQHGALVD